MGLLLRLVGFGAAGVAIYYIGIYVLAAIVAVGLVWLLMAGESAVLGD